MSKHKHTQGPWEATLNESCKGYAATIHCKGGNVAMIPFQKGDGFENARLIAAAPDLLEACKSALDPDPCQLDHHGNCQAHGLGNPCSQKLLREAIEKAEGEAK